MSSPMVETIREIPLTVERDYHMKNEDTGFPFDDEREDQEDPHFRSQLDDIAARHPEFAQHFGSFPFRSGSRTRTQIPEHFTNQQRFAEAPFEDRFERFGFPFDEPFREAEQKPYYQRYPKYYPKQNSQEEIGEQSSSNQESQSKNIEADSEPVDQQEPERGRRPKQNIQQSNTVDLGQPQEPVDDRNQRSMSAPPPNNRPRFVSSINIPVNQPREKMNIPHDNSQASAPSQPQERVIPIHVEGRDEPVLPKKYTSQNTSQPQTHQQQPQPCTDKFFTQRTPNFSQYFNRDQQFQNDWFPRGFHGKQPQAEPNVNQSSRGRSPQPQPKPEYTHQSPNKPRQAETQHRQPQMKEEREEPKLQEAPKPQVSGKVDPIGQIKSIQKDVSELMGQVDQFKGKPKDKYYLYLDEMLTRNLIKLDNIDTEGQENIRQARKEAIKCIEKCISILESKANANVSDELQREKVMEVENTVPIVELSSKENTKDTAENVVEDEKTMEVEKFAAPKEEAMEFERTTDTIEPPKADITEPDETPKLDKGATEKLESNSKETLEREKVEQNTENNLQNMEQNMPVVTESEAKNIPSVTIDENISGQLAESTNGAFDKNTEENKEQEEIKSEGTKDSETCNIEVNNEDEKKEKKKPKKKVDKK